MKRFVVQLGGGILSVLILFACSEKKVAKRAPIEIPVVEVLQTDVPVYREFVGQVYGEKDIPIRARVEGFLEGIHFNEGSFVKKGQLLYTIDPQPFEARVNTQKSKVAEAETRLAKAKSDLDRYKPLAEQNAVSKSDLDAAQANYDAAVSSVAAEKSNLRSSQIELGYTKIYSPISGLIGMTQAKVGDFVGREPNPVILNTTSKTDHVKVKFYLTEGEYIYLVREYGLRREEVKTNEDLDSTQRAELELILSDGSVYGFKGKVDFIDRGIDASTGSLLVQSDFPNPRLLLRPGMYAKIKLAVKEIKGGILVPQRCVKELQGQYSVFVVTDSNTVVNRQIVAGPTYKDYWIVEEGLSPGDKIVFEGIQKVSGGAKVKPVLTEFKSKFKQ